MDNDVVDAYVKREEIPEDFQKNPKLFRNRESGGKRSAFLKIVKKKSANIAHERTGYDKAKRSNRVYLVYDGHMICDEEGREFYQDGSRRRNASSEPYEQAYNAVLTTTNLKIANNNMAFRATHLNFDL
ncbi:hypothetical protein Tcan_07260 [Toxocara canis]|uniref:Uncharacterized protein n=1 Tax=Toxocara canis TaxID=6265 RepID=A0A0B2UNX3_TOXCA|nr:hypothetical protein Tcan_07260 [Toxocara canis]